MWQEFYSKHRANHFSILSVAVDVQGPAAATPWWERARATFTAVVDPVDVLGATFGLKAIPVSILVDEVGIIRLMGGGPTPQFLAQIESLLQEPVSAVRGTSSDRANDLPLEKLRIRGEQRPADAAAQLAWAQALGQSGEFTAAIAACELAAKLDSKTAAIPFTHANLLLRLGQTNAAISKFVVARDLDPDNWRIRKQIWALQNPSRFYGSNGIDWSWQKEQVAREKTDADRRPR